MTQETLEVLLKAAKSMQVIRMAQMHSIKKTNGSKSAVDFLMQEYNEFCDAQKAIVSELSLLKTQENEIGKN